jgi:hypothetical protein
MNKKTSNITIQNRNRLTVNVTVKTSDQKALMLFMNSTFIFQDSKPKSNKKGHSS